MAQVRKQDTKPKDYQVSVSTGSGEPTIEIGPVSSEFSRFKELASKLVRIPKDELDAKLRKS